MLVRRSRWLRLALTRADLKLFPEEQHAKLVQVQVSSPLRLSGWAPIERYGLVPGAKVAAGIVHTGTQTTLSKAHMIGDAALGELAVGGAIAEQVRVACGALTTAPPEGPEPELVLGPSLLRPKYCGLPCRTRLTQRSACGFATSWRSPSALKEAGWLRCPRLMPTAAALRVGPGRRRDRPRGRGARCPRKGSGILRLRLRRWRWRVSSRFRRSSV